MPLSTAGFKRFFVPRRCFTKNEDWNRLGLKRRSQYEPTRQYEYAPAYSEGPVSGLKGQAYSSKTGRDAGVEDCIQRRRSSTTARTRTRKSDGLLR